MFVLNTKRYKFHSCIFLKPSDQVYQTFYQKFSLTLLPHYLHSLTGTEQNCFQKVINSAESILLQVKDKSRPE